MQKRIVIIVETIIVAILAIAVVIYVQVLIQQYILQPQPVVSTGPEENLNPATSRVPSTEERLQILQSLKVTSLEEVSAEDRKVILEKVSPKPTEVTPLSAATDEVTIERLKILESLQAN